MVLSYPLIHKLFSTDGFLLNLVRTSPHCHPQQARTKNTSNALATSSFLIYIKMGGAED